MLQSNCEGSINMGLEEMVTINQMVDPLADIAGERIEKRRDVPGGAADGRSKTSTIPP